MLEEPDETVWVTCWAAVIPSYMFIAWTKEPVADFGGDCHVVVSYVSPDSDLVVAIVPI